MPIHTPKDPILHSFASTNALQEALVEFILKAQKESIEKKGRFTVAFSGGSLPGTLKGLIGNTGVKWDKW
jgi:6-phosphogluconolactonase